MTETKTYRAMKERILVRMKERREDVTVGGIIRTQVAEEERRVGVIYDVGEGIEDKRLQPGVEILIAKWGGEYIDWRELNWSSVKEEHVLAIVGADGMLEMVSDWILLKGVDDEENKTAGGIILPDTAREKSKRCVVVNRGSCEDVENGDTIILRHRAGQHFFKRQGEAMEVIVCKPHEIMGVVERDV